jgi:hypothetical protein
VKGLLIIVSAAALCFPQLLAAQASGENHIYAQKLVDTEMNRHPELHLMGLHSVRADGGPSAIIACSNKAKVGKKSDPDDLEVQQTGKPTVEEKKERGIYDLGFPLLDRNGTTIGTVVMEIKTSASKSKQAALRKGQRIQSELQGQISSKAQLFEPI